MELISVTGRHIDVEKITPSDIHIWDIASALSKLCRFAGHTREFYSVAQHSVRVSMYLPQPLKLAGLLHDAAEAYLADLPTPVKQLMPGYRVLEGHVLAAICERYRLPMTWAPEIKEADKIALVTEFQELMLSDPKDLPKTNKRLPYERPMTPNQARLAFIAQYVRVGEEKSTWLH